MLIILLVLLICIDIYIFKIVNKDYLSPSLITCCIYTVGTFFSILGNKKWEGNITFLTVLVIVTAVIFTLIGEIIIRGKWNNNNNNDNNKFNYKIIDIPLFITIIILGVSILACIYNYQNIREYLISDDNFSLFYLRNMMLNGNIQNNFILVILSFFAQAAGYIYLYIFITNTLLIGIKNCLRKYFIHLIAVLPLIFLTIISTSRTGYINIFVFILVVYLLQSKRIGDKNFSMFNVVKKVILAIVAFFIIFSFIGELRNIEEKDTENYFVLYAGSPIVALNSYLNEYIGPNDIFGEETLAGLRGTLNKFIPNIEQGNFFLEYTYFSNGDSTNVYSLIRSLIADYGYIGFMCMEIMIGIFYMCFLVIVRNKNYILFDIYFAMFIYYLVQQLFTPTIFTSFMSITQIALFAFIFFINFILKFSKKIKIRLN